MTHYIGLKPRGARSAPYETLRILRSLPVKLFLIRLPPEAR